MWLLGCFIVAPEGSTCAAEPEAATGLLLTCCFKKICMLQEEERVPGGGAEPERTRHLHIGFLCVVIDTFIHIAWPELFYKQCWK